MHVDTYIHNYIHTYIQHSTFGANSVLEDNNNIGAYTKFGAGVTIGDTHTHTYMHTYSTQPSELDQFLKTTTTLVHTANLVLV